MYLYLLSFAAALAYLLYRMVSFRANWLRVQHLDIPKVLNPLCPSNVVWVLLQPLVLPTIEFLPFSFGKWVRYSRWGWEFREGARTHLELGDVWMQVTPSMNWIYVADPGLISEIFHRRDDFRRPLQLYSMLSIFGPNVGTTEGPDWQRHRKITNSGFSEETNALVWAESLRQSADMLNWWMSRIGSVQSTAKDVRALSLNVLAFAGFRKVYAFDGEDTPENGKEHTSFRQSLCTVLDNALLTLLVPPKLLLAPICPRSWKRVGRSIEGLQKHMTELYHEEKNISVEESREVAGNLIASMVKASKSDDAPECSQLSNERNADKRQIFGRNEIFGNIFVFYFAGHDTTAAAFAYAMLLMAAHPEIQSWVAEEVDLVLGEAEIEDLEYTQVFPRLRRCLAVLYETVRLYDPIPGLPKWTGEEDRRINYHGKTLVIPAKTFVLPSLMAVHKHPRYWGQNAEQWQPRRWIKQPLGNVQTQAGSEDFFTPMKGTFFPWSDGQRNCPGKKFAQVEFVAVIARLFRRHAVAPVCLSGEDAQMAQQRVMSVVNDSSVRLLLQMRDPARVALSWSVRR